MRTGERGLKSDSGDSYPWQTMTRVDPSLILRSSGLENEDEAPLVSYQWNEHLLFYPRRRLFNMLPARL